jgi:hypothetical protein
MPHDGIEKCTQNFVLRNLKRDHMEVRGVDMRIIVLSRTLGSRVGGYGLDSSGSG